MIPLPHAAYFAAAMIAFVAGYAFFQWRKHPALFFYLTANAVAAGVWCALGDHPAWVKAWMWMQFPLLFLRFCMVCEWMRNFAPHACLIAAFAALSFSAAGWHWHAVGLVQSAIAWRQYAELALFLSVLSAMIYDEFHGGRDDGYGCALLLHMSARAVGATAGKGGILWLAIERTSANWQILDATICLAQALSLLAWALLAYRDRRQGLYGRFAA